MVFIFFLLPLIFLFFVLKVSSRLFVGGIDASISEEDLEIYFSQFGEIMKAEVIRDKRTRISKGYGFIKCRDKDTAQIILNQRHRIGNRNIDVNNAAEKWETSTTKNNLYEKKLFISGITPNIENGKPSKKTLPHPKNS